MSHIDLPLNVSLNILMMYASWQIQHYNYICEINFQLKKG